MARWPFALFLVCVIVAVAVSAAFSSNESPVAWFFASWAMYALIVFGICAGVRARMPRAIAIAVFAPLGPLPVLTLFSALSDMPPALFWLVPVEELCDFMFGRANDASGRTLVAMDLLHEGGIYLVFERSDAGGRKIVHLDRAGTMAMHNAPRPISGVGVSAFTHRDRTKGPAAHRGRAAPFCALPALVNIPCRSAATC